MRKEKLRWFGKIGLILLSLFVVFACVSAPENAGTTGKPGVVREQYTNTPLEITFVETSDVHGVIFPYNFITAKSMPTSLAQVSTLVSELRNTRKNVVLLENGDSLQGQPTVYYYNFEKTSVPHIWSQVVNYLPESV